MKYLLKWEMLSQNLNKHNDGEILNNYNIIIKEDE